LEKLFHKETGIFRLSENLIAVKDLFSGSNGKTPLSFLDVRSQGEEEAGTFSGVKNLPLLTDEERHLVGLCYHEKGTEEAVALGHQLVSGKTKEKRIQAWINFILKKKPHAIFCWRGGMRSEISQRWLKESGCDIPRVRGGYKAIRNVLTSIFDKVEFPMIVISGKTGVGKTKFLKSLRNQDSVIDLEGLAHHRGSAFGEELLSQPSQATFENNLALQLFYKQKAANFILEAESRAIGRVHIPPSFFSAMQNARFLILKIPLEDRISNIVDEYVKEPWERFKTTEENPALFLENYLLKPITKIKDRLGGARFQECSQLVTEACCIPQKKEDFSLHRLWIEKILSYYYDPYYEKYEERHSANIIGQGSPKELLRILDSLT
jgi:tRNA 2-selenouridine synthase